MFAPNNLDPVERTILWLPDTDEFFCPTQHRSYLATLSPEEGNRSNEV